MDEVENLKVLVQEETSKVERVKKDIEFVKEALVREKRGFQDVKEIIEHLNKKKPARKEDL